MSQRYEVLLPHSAGLLSAVLPCYSYDDDNRQNILFFLFFIIYKYIVFAFLNIFLNHHQHTFEIQPKRSILFYDN